MTGVACVVAIACIFELGTTWVLDRIQDEFAIVAPPSPASAIPVGVTASPELDTLNRRVAVADNGGEVRPIKVLARAETDVQVIDCATTTVTLSLTPDARWYAIAQRVARHRTARIFNDDPGTASQVGSLRRAFAPAIYLSLPADISGVRAGEPTGFGPLPRPHLVRVDRAAGYNVYALRLDVLRGPLVRQDAYGFAGPTYTVSFAADWVTRRGKQSCYVDVPAVTVQDIVPLLSPPTFLSAALGTLFDSEIRFTAAGYRLLRDESEPPPDESSGRAVWRCKDDDLDRGFSTGRTACRASIALQALNAEGRSQANVVLWSTLLGVVGSLLFEFAFGGVHRVRTLVMRLFGTPPVTDGDD